MKLLDLVRDERFFPGVMMALCFVSAIRYAISCKWGPCTYWTGASLLNLAVTFLMR